jgi:hypothetical protein
MWEIVVLLNAGILGQELLDIVQRTALGVRNLPQALLQVLPPFVLGKALR